MGRREPSEQEISEEAVRLFVDWLYDQCPVDPSEVPRARMRALWDLYQHEGVTPSRYEIIVKGKPNLPILLHTK